MSWLEFPSYLWSSPRPSSIFHCCCCYCCYFPSCTATTCRWSWPRTVCWCCLVPRRRSPRLCSRPGCTSMDSAVRRWTWMEPAGQWSPGTRSILGTARIRGRIAGTCWRSAGGWCTRWCGFGARAPAKVAGSMCWKRCPTHCKNKSNKVLL